ncbi:hypothetical protein IGB42_00954 [Andreprevotia sp. IGB-42]|uniref:hypothetical protein n=1 Tax=Andreprevotia sp. IGB-42 TaxID=2497473 RepID=UPI001359E8B2|nr:hypothetical protein [Andreprevotia sp. IGB-42]KAF0814898.1 hypothetical protein IGB42_00954 [Andreprevotia sp. IGB-42]
MRSLVIIALLAICNLAGATELAPGQTGAYQTRPGEADSTLTILKVEKYNDLGPVVHIRVDKIRMKNPVKGNVVTNIPHLPFKEAAIRSSITRLLSRATSVPAFQEGYDTWKTAYLAGKAGAFNIPVSATLDGMLGAKWTEK